MTEPVGYRLAVDPQQVDAHRFRTLVSQARAAVAARRAGEARQRYRAGLGLWRGPVLDGVDGELARQFAGGWRLSGSRPSRSASCEELIISSEVNLRRGRPDDARKNAEQVLSLAEIVGYRYAAAVAQRQRSKVLTAMGRTAEADRAGLLAAETIAELRGSFGDPLIELLVGQPGPVQSTVVVWISVQAIIDEATG